MLCTSSPPLFFASVDLGSNSFHLLIAQFESGEIKISERFSEKVQLGRSVTQSGYIDDAAFKRGIQCAQHFQERIAQYTHIKTKVCGTQALRKAGNANLFLEALTDIGFDVEIIHGEEEARLIYQGVSHSLPQNKGDNILVIDIGGGSTEFAIGLDQQFSFAQSLPMGCISWSELYFPKGKIKKEYWQQAQLSTESQLKQLNLPINDFDQIIASSGSAKLLKNLCNEINEQHNMITLEGLKTIKKQCFRYSNIDQLDFKKLKSHRRDLLIPGLSIMIPTMEHLGIKSIQFSKSALREGVVIDLYQEEEQA